MDCSLLSPEQFSELNRLKIFGFTRARLAFEMRFMAMPIEFARLTCRTLSLEYNFANVTC